MKIRFIKFNKAASFFIDKMVLFAIVPPIQTHIQT